MIEYDILIFCANNHRIYLCKSCKCIAWETNNAHRSTDLHAAYHCINGRISPVKKDFVVILSKLNPLHNVQVEMMIFFFK